MDRLCRHGHPDDFLPDERYQKTAHHQLNRLHLVCDLRLYVGCHPHRYFQRFYRHGEFLLFVYQEKRLIKV